MMSLQEVKTWLAEVRKTSWHYKVVQWAGVKVPTKACAYWWVCLPKALAMTVLALIAMSIVLALNWIIGFYPNFHSKSGSGFFPYKTYKDGTKNRFAPWQIIVIALAIWGLLLATIWVPVIIKEILGGVLLLLILTGVTWFTAGMIYLARKFLRFVVRRSPEHLKPKKQFKELWDKICPPLVVKDEGNI